MKRLMIFRLATIASMALMIGAFFAPMWWVALKAPNYPEQTFPDGVRVDFHLDGVRNGCTQRSRAEVQDDEPLDCVHEMNTINHFIGMEPMEKGAQFEFMVAPYVVGLFSVLLLVSLFYQGPLWWLLPMGAIGFPIGFVGVFAYWMWWFGHNLHPWGAFTVKPFMPTILGVGKVAQFSTYCYPSYGFFMLVLSALLAMFSILVKVKIVRAAKKAQG